ncbi:GlyGly-CTERM sorting domain-containing protein [Weissella confusa]|nr:GlyGly-CTERM sorting domain-containing protein [Weissella confusa]MCT8392696.1 GlyGly-CTERM sorting domain-containing protein [Weissella confusa]
MDNNDNRPLWLRPWFWLLALFFIGRRKKKNKQPK